MERTNRLGRYFASTTNPITTGMYTITVFMNGIPIATFESVLTEGALTIVDEDEPQASTIVIGAGAEYRGVVDPATGDFDIIRGDDYYATEGRRLEWNLPDGETDITGGTALLSISHYKLGTLIQDHPGTILASGSGVTQTVGFELDTSQTVLLTPSRKCRHDHTSDYSFDVQITVPNGNHVTPIIGTGTVRQEYSTPTGA